MTTIPSDIAFTPSVKAIQSAKGSREGYIRMEESGGWRTEAWDGNCRKHIHKRIPESAMATVIKGLQSRIADLESDLTKLQQNLTDLR